MRPTINAGAVLRRNAATTHAGLLGIAELPVETRNIDLVIDLTHFYHASIYSSERITTLGLDRDPPRLIEGEKK